MSALDPTTPAASSHATAATGVPATTAPVSDQASLTRAARASAMPHVRALDGARGLAVGLVLAYHFGVPGLPGGFLGVDLFFVLSGFLITSLLVGEGLGTGRIDFVQFWYRRARRLLPALFVLIAVIALWSTTADPVAKGPLRWDLLASLAYVANWRFILTGESYFEAFTTASPVRHLWSLAIEEQFYVVWPLAVAGAFAVIARWPRRGTTIVLGGLLVAAVASILVMAIGYDEADPSVAYYSTLARVHELVIGGIAALIVASHGGIRAALVRWSGWLAAMAAIVVVAAAATLHDTDAGYYLGGSVLFSIAVAVLIAALVVGREGGGLASRVLGLGPIVALGVISYGVYLWHWPMVVWLTPATTGLDGPALFALRLGLTLGVAAVSFVLVERPIRHGRLGPLRLRPMTAFAAAGVCLIVLSAGSVLATRGWKPVPSYLSEDPTMRVTEATDERRTIGLVGDSIMRSLYPGFAAAAKADGDTTASAALAGCAVGDQMRIEEDGQLARQTERCAKQAPELQGRLVRVYDPDVVFWYSGRDRYDIAIGERTLQAGSPEWKAVAFADWDRTLDRLRARGAEVRLILPFFNEGSDPAHCVQPADLATERCTQPLENGALRQVYQEWAAGHVGEVTVVDVADRLCPADPCPATLDGVKLRQDGDIIHFSERGARMVAEWLLDDRASDPGG